MLANSKAMKYPVKIGEKLRIPEYAATLLQGEEQLLITRDCNFYLTVGDGTYKEFKTINSGLTKEEINNIINNLNTDILEKINNTNQDVIDLTDMITLEFVKYLTKEEYELKIKEIEDKIKSEKHLNRQVLNLFSEGATGEPMYNGKTIVVDFDTTNLVRQNNFDSFKTDINDSILILDNKITQNKEDELHGISMIQSEITELKETTVKIEDYTSLPSFSSNQTIKN